MIIILSRAEITDTRSELHSIVQPQLGKGLLWKVALTCATSTLTTADAESALSRVACLHNCLLNLHISPRVHPLTPLITHFTTGQTSGSPGLSGPVLPLENVVGHDH